MLHRLLQLAGVFLKLGTISFGGPAAHLAMIEDEVVGRRGWLARDRFLDLVGATHLIPGPNAVEMAAHVGFLRAGLLGTLVAGLAFTLPATLIAIACAWGYQRYGTLPAVEAPKLSAVEDLVVRLPACL
jgi:chromate transporter